MTMRNSIVIGAGLTLVAWAVGLNVHMWQWWLFIISANIVTSVIRLERQK